MIRRISTWLVLAGFGVGATSSESAASGFMVRENSAASVATVFAGNASRADEVATVFNNPAGMSWLTGSQTQIGATGVFPSINFEGEATVFGTPIPADNSRNNGQFALVPHAYAVFDLHERLKAGLAITVPFGNTVDYSEDWSGRYVNIKTAALTVDINPNLSYRLTPRIAIAGGISLQYLKLDLSSKIPQFLFPFLPPGSPDGGFLLSVDNWDWGYNFGVLTEPWDGTRIGMTFRSGIDHETTGTLTFEPTTTPLLGLVDSPATADLAVPASITGSITQQLTPDFSLSADVQFTGWHTFKQVVVNSNNPTFVFHEEYRDTWMVSVGGVYRVNPSWTLRAGFGFDQSPVVDAFRDTGVPDKDRYMVGIGFGYQFTPSVSLDVGYAHYFAAGHATMNESVNRIEPITGAVILNGRYDNAMNHLSISLRTAL
jgi:long-chain fatty acid transport protein